MNKRIIILCMVLLSSLASFAQESTLTRTLVNRKYGFGYPSLTKKDKLGYPLVEVLVIPARYDETTPATFSDQYDNLVAVLLDGKWGFIDATGATKIPFMYDVAGALREGLAPVELNGKFGYINKSGKTVIPFKYENANNFFEGLAYVELGGKAGFINKTGTAVIPIKYDKETHANYEKCEHCGEVYVFQNGKATVVLDGKCGTVDSKGNFSPCETEPELVLDSTYITGVLNSKKDLWGNNAGVHILSSCDTRKYVTKMTINEQPDYAYQSSTNDNKLMNAGFNRMWKPGQKVTIKIVHQKGCTFKLSGNQGGKLCVFTP